MRLNIHSTVVVAFALLTADNITTCGDQFSTEYKFPQTTKELMSSLSTKDKIVVFDIPAWKARSMSTRGLVEACFEYPLLDFFHYFNSAEQGFDKVYQNFTGLRELLQRQDAPREILNRYKLFRVSGFATTKKLEKENYINFQFFNYLLTLPKVLDELTDREHEEALRVALKNAQFLRKRNGLSGSEAFTDRLALTLILQRGVKLDGRNGKIGDEIFSAADKEEFLSQHKLPIGALESLEVFWTETLPQ